MLEEYLQEGDIWKYSIKRWNIGNGSKHTKNQSIKNEYQEVLPQS